MSREIRQQFRKQLTKEKLIQAPGVYDALTATMVKQVGFKAVYLSGAGVSYSLLGKPDLGFITMTEMVERARYICEAVDLPVIADGDTGYGNALNVIRTVKEYEHAGIVAIQIEDQVFPKKCGHMANKIVIPTEEMVSKIKAATDARRDENFLIIARTDTRYTDGLTEAIERGQQYLEAGADIIFVEAPQSEEELLEVSKSINCPLVANMVEGGKTPILPAEKLEKLGYKIAIYPNSVTRAMTKMGMKLYQELKNAGTTLDLKDDMYEFNELNELLDLSKYKSLEEKYKV